VPEPADFATKIKAARVLVDGGSMRSAAAASGLNVSTISRYVSNEDEEFADAVRAVEEYDAANPPVDVLPNLMAGSRGLPIGSEGPNMNDRLRAAAGRSSE